VVVVDDGRIAVDVLPPVRREVDVVVEEGVPTVSSWSRAWVRIVVTVTSAASAAAPFVQSYPARSAAAKTAPPA
jgi:hypothetical protein